MHHQRRLTDDLEIDWVAGGDQADKFAGFESSHHRPIYLPGSPLATFLKMMCIVISLIKEAKR